MALARSHRCAVKLVISNRDPTRTTQAIDEVGRTRPGPVEGGKSVKVLLASVTAPEGLRVSGETA